MAHDRRSGFPQGGRRQAEGAARAGRAGRLTRRRWRRWPIRGSTGSSPSGTWNCTATSTTATGSSSNPDRPRSTPEILEHAEHVELPDLNRERVIDLKLDGTKEAELYRMLLVAQCNALHSAMPFLFERIGDETELVLPESLLHSDSIDPQAGLGHRRGGLAGGRDHRLALRGRTSRSGTRT